MTPEKPDEPITKGVSNPYSQNRFSLLSHDLRAALSDILGGLRLVDKTRLDPETLSHLDRVGVSAETLTRLLDKTLNDDPAGQETPVTQAINVNLADFLEDTNKRWTDRALAAGIEFKLDRETSLPAIITVDRVSLDRVLANLIGNAIKFTDVGQVRLSVECGQDRALKFCVRDEGSGFSPQAMAQLYQYEGRPEAAEKPGSGLGLYIAKELSDLLGATLEIRNRKGNGALALLCLPHESWFDRSLRRDGRMLYSVPDEQVDLTGMRILLAEDNKTNQLVATQMLRSMGAEFAVASDGIEALELLEVDSFDLALLDIEMPRMTGLELIKAIRAKPEPMCNMPLVALTAYVMREHRERIYNAGANGIIAKPVISISELGLSIRDHYSGTKSRNFRVLPRVTTSEPSEGQPSDMVVDQSVFEDLLNTIGPASIGELLGRLQADTDAVAEGLVRGRKALDLAEIRSQTHILISVAGAIGAKPLQLIAQRLNSAANRQEAEGVDELCGTCLSGLKELQGFILAEQSKTEAQA